VGRPVSPSLRVLGAAVKRHREAAGMTQEKLAGLVSYSKAWLSNLETGHLCPHKQTVLDLEKHLGLPEKVLFDIFELVKYEDPHPVLAFERYADAECRATIIRQYNALVVPGLLQTPEYARALIEAGRPTAKPEVIERLLSDRLARQEILQRDDPPALWLIVDESALRRPVGGRDVHMAQLDALIEAARRPGIGIQVISFSTGAHAGLTCSFTILSFKDQSDAVYTEDNERGYFREKPELVRLWFDSYEALRADTLPVAASLELIRHIREEL
jgi:transcriptional regulator with XRE-family HTH domain